MTRQEYQSIVNQLIDSILSDLYYRKLLTPENAEPLRDELLTAIDWACAPKSRAN
jgi:hypothetical protein